MATNSLNSIKVHQTRATISRLHIFFHLIAVLSILYYRFSHILKTDVPIFSWSLIFIAELILTLTWLLLQPLRWRPVTRSVYTENLPQDKDLPRINVFICTCDPKKEPIVGVMNTVLSAMALDYPTEKLSVYLSDDGGSALTLYGIKEACVFAKFWVPFCRKYGIKTRCPEAYFSSFGDIGECFPWSDEFKAEEDKIKLAYGVLKKNVENIGIDDSVVHDRPASVEVIHDNRQDDQIKMPLLVYVSREERPSQPHRFKAGALNALLRVSGIMSNAPYLLVLDCDMYCNDPSSARQAMCFHLDSKMSTSLGFVQFPQMFYNVSKNDIYNGQSSSANKIKWPGMDGLLGPYFLGTNYYMKKKAIYGNPDQEGTFLIDSEKNFGLSSMFIASLSDINEQDMSGKKILSDAILEEARTLASCAYEKNTKWGKEIGYSYGGLLESTLTGYLLHCKGWTSTYLYPKRPCFLGCTAIDLKDASVQLMKWSSGALQVGLSKFSPLTYGMSRMPILHSMCYGFFMLHPLSSIGVLLYAIVPQLCFLNGVPMFPKASNPWFSVFAIVYASSLSQHLYEVFSTGGSFITWRNEQRMWMITSVTSCLFGCIDFLLQSLNITKVNFKLSNKAVEQEKIENYAKGKFNFEGANKFVVPLKLLVILNAVCFVGGMKRVIRERDFEEMFGQIFISSFILAFSYPILEDLFPRKGR